MESGGVLQSTLVRDLLEMVPDAIVVVDLSGQIAFANEVATTLFGYPRHALVGQRLSTLMPLEHRAQHEEHVRRFVTAPERRAMGTRTGLQARRADGSTFPVDVALSSLDGEGARFVVAAIRDMTERMRLERVELEHRERLVVSERLATTGMLAAAVAHEINNPLTALLTNLELLGSRPDAGPELLAECLEAAHHIRTVAQDLKTFGRTNQELMPLSPRAVLESSVRMTRHLLTARARLVTQLEDVAPVLGSAGKLTQVFINLLVNAAQALPEAAASQHTIAIELREEDDLVRCDVSDTGRGIPEEQLSQLFSAFFTTKRDGLGLGLSISHRVVTEHGGTLSVSSVVGRGTTFTVRLPRAPQS